MSLTRRQSKVKGQEKELKTTLPRANSKFARMEDKFSPMRKPRQSRQVDQAPK